jgi:hypothetical protein
MGRSWLHDINNWNAKQMSYFWPFSQTKAKQQVVSASLKIYTTWQTLPNGVFREDIIFQEKYFFKFYNFPCYLLFYESGKAGSYVENKREDKGLEKKNLGRISKVS